jgi:hypothetical protein
MKKKKSILHKKKNENQINQYDLNFEEYKNLAAIKFHSSKKVNFKPERNEPLNISINEIEKNYRRNSYQYVYSTNNKNNYTKFGFCPNAQNINSKKIDYLLDDEITQQNNKNIYEKILGIKIKKDKKTKKLNNGMINNKDSDDDSDDNKTPMKKRPRNYSFYESKSTKNVNVYDYIDTKQDNNDDKNKDSNYNNTSFYCSNQVKNNLIMEDKYSSKTLKLGPHLDGEVFNNHSIVFITDKSDPFKKSYSHNIKYDLKFDFGNEADKENHRLSLQNNTIENRKNFEISELSENSSGRQLEHICLENKKKEENNINDNINKKDIQKEEIIKNNKIIKQKKINHQKEIMKTKNKKKISPSKSKEKMEENINNKKKINKNKDNSNLVDQLLSKEFLISINSRDSNKMKDKNIQNIDKDEHNNFNIQKKNSENLSEEQIEELKKSLYKSNSNSNGGQGIDNPKDHINKDNLSKDREIKSLKIKGNHQNGKNIKPSIENLINSKNGEKKIFYNKINKSNRIKMNKSKKGKFKKYNSYNRYNGNFNNNSNKRNNKKSNSNTPLSISQKMSKYTGIINKTFGEINNNSYNNINKLRNNIINNNNKNIVGYKAKNVKNNNMNNNRIKKNIITINNYNNLNENEKNDLNQNNYIYNGNDEELKIILNDNPDINNKSYKAIRNKQIVNFIYKKREIREKENENNNPVNKLNDSGNEIDNLNKNKEKINSSKEKIRKLNENNNSESQAISTMNGLNSNSFSKNEKRNRNRVSLDMPLNIDLNKFANGGLNQDNKNKKHLFSLSDNLNDEIIKEDIKIRISGNLKSNKYSNIGKLNKFVKNIKSDEEEGKILIDDKIEHFNTDPPLYAKSFGENKITKDNNINIGNQKEKEIIENKLNGDNKNINEKYFNEEFEYNCKGKCLKNGDIDDIKIKQENDKEKIIIENNKNNNDIQIDNINIDSINYEQEILGNDENIKNNTVNDNNNSNNDSTNTKELKSEYEFNINEGKFYKPLNTYENIVNFKKINPFLNHEN